MERNEIYTLLLDCLHEDAGRVGVADLRALSADDWRALTGLALKKRVGPLLYARLRERKLDHTVPPDIMDRLYKRYERNSLQVLRLDAALNKLARALQDDDVPILVLKGAYLAAVVYDNIALREMNDLDILVHRPDLAKVVHALQSLGFKPERPFAIERELATELHLPRYSNQEGTTVEVHWNLTHPGLPYSVGADEFWDRTVPATIAGVTVRGLSPEDLLLYLAMHVSYQHYFIMGMRPFLDIAAVVRRYGNTLDWSLVQRRAGRWHWGKGAYVALRLAKELVGAAVPDDVLHALRPTAFDETILAAAREQSLADAVVAIGVSPGVAHLQGSARLREKVPLLLRDLFPSTRTIYRDYGIAPESPRAYLYYIVRLKDLFVKRSGAATQVLRGDRTTARAAARNHLLWQWLAE